MTRALTTGQSDTLAAILTEVTRRGYDIQLTPDGVRISESEAD